MGDLKSANPVINRLFGVLVLFFVFLATPAAAIVSSGDIDGDGDVDREDLTILLADRNKPVDQSTCGEDCDLDGDGIITVLDARKLVLLCTLPRCAIVSHENRPPTANAGQDRVIVLEAGQKTVDVTLDGSASSDPDGTVTGYQWTGTPDPDDVAAPVVALNQGVHPFSLLVTDDQGAESALSTVNITVIGPPLIVPPPAVTRDPAIPIKGVSLPGDIIVINNKTTGEVKEVDNPNGFFEEDLDLATGPNEIEVFAKIDAVQSPSVLLKTTYAPTAVLALDSIDPSSGQTGSMVTLTGSGFTADTQVMGVYFKGAEFEGKGVVIEAAEDHLKVVVPFIFIKSAEDLEVSVYDQENISNAIAFHVVPAQDPTPDVRGNEVDDQFNLILAQLQNVFDKLEQWTQPNVSPDTWSILEENLHRLQDFVETVKSRVDAIPDESIKSNLDAVFGSEYFTLIRQKLEQANAILSHTTPCDINEVIEILNEILEPIRIINDILDTTLDTLYAGLVLDSISCFSGICIPCCGFIPVLYEVINSIAAIDGVIDAILSVVDTVVDVLRAAIPTTPSEWKVAVSGPIPGISNHILYTDTTNELSVYANFTNAGFEQLLSGQVDLSIGIPGPLGIFGVVEEITGVDIQALIEDALGDLLVDLVVDLLDIDEIHLTFADIQVSSTVASTDPSSPLTLLDEGVDAETHTILAGASLGTDDLDIQAACGAFQYPHRTKCEQLVGNTCTQWGTDYPEYFPMEVIDVPVIENWHWQQTTYWDDHCNYNPAEDRWEGCWRQRYDLDVDGKGFSGLFGRFKVSWNDDEQYAGNAGTDAFDVYGNPWGHKPGWLSVAVISTDGKRRESTPIYIPGSPDLEANFSLKNPSAYPGDTVYAVGNYFTSYPSDALFSLSQAGGLQAQINPSQIWWKNAATQFDVLAFEIPDLRAFDDTQFLATLQVGQSPYITSAQENLKLLAFESAGTTGVDDQDLMVFSDQNAYIRSAAVGNLNGDGVNDLVVGAPSAGRDAGHPVGAVYIKFGPVEGLDLQYGESVRSVVDLNSDWDVKIYGDIHDVDSGGNSRRIGKSLAIGDVNGDGIEDLIIGTSDRNDDDQHRADIDLGYTAHPAHIPGKAYVIYGSTNWQQQYLLYQDQYDVKFYGDDDRELGFQVGVGGIYGQNQEDLVITAPADVLNNLTSRVYVIQGWQGALAAKDIRLPDDLDIFSHHAIIEGKNYYQHDPLTGTDYIGSGLGKALTLGDINGDGLDDIVLGAPAYSQDWSTNPWTGLQGAVYIFYGKPQDQDPLDGVYPVDAKTNNTGNYTAIWGPRTRAVNEITRFGSAVTVADLNDDGKGELIVGAPAARLELQIRPSMLLAEGWQSIADIEAPQIGRIYIFNGDNPELGQPKTTADYDADVIVNGSTSISHFGEAFSSGDINNDGITDLLVGAPGRTDARGHVWVLYGAQTPFWLDTAGQDLVQLQDRSRYNGYPVHFRDLDYSSFAPTALEEGLDYLFIGPEPKPVDLPGFGAFVAAGDLNPYVGDDVLVIDPAADAPNPPSPSGLRDYSGMLYIFYEGSTEFWPLTISPAAATMNVCGGEQVFAAHGGQTPYQFSWFGCSQTSIGVLCSQGLPGWFQAQYNGDQVRLSLDQCVDENFKNLKLAVSDAAGDETFSWISFARPQLAVSPTSIDFGDVELGQTVNGIITVSNAGNADLRINSIVASGDMQQTHDCPAELAPGASCTITAIFAPAVESPAAGVITIASEDPYHPTAEVQLQGRGVVTQAPDMVLFGGNLVFIDVPLGSSQSQDIIIHNAGNTDLTIGNVSVSGAPEFALTANQCTGTLAPYTPLSPVTCTLTVTFTPADTGTVYGTITIASNDPDTPVFTGSLSGNGIGPFLAAEPGSIDFANAKTRILITIQNQSASSNLEWSIKNDLPPWLSASTMSGEVAPGAIDRIVLLADRAGLDTGTYQHALSLVSNGGDKEIDVTMTVPVSLAAFARTFGGEGGEYASSVRPTSDGGFIVTGLTNSYGNGAEDVWILKIDGSGYIQWEKTLGGPDAERGYDIRQTSDGGYIVAAGSYSAGAGDYGLWVLNLDQMDDVEWQKYYGGLLDDNWGDWGVNFSIRQTQDGGYVVAGNTQDPGFTAGGSDAWVLKLDSSGEVEWQKSYGGTDDDYANWVEETDDRGFIVCGVTESFGAGNEDIWVLKLDSSGAVEWQKAYGGTDYDYGYSVQQTQGGGYVLLGTSYSFGGAWVLKLDSDGEVVWQNTYGGFDGAGSAISQTQDGGFIVAGSYYRSGRGDDAWLFKLGADGDLEWQRTFGGDRIDVAYSVCQTPDGGFVTAGYTNSFRTTSYGSGNYDLWVIRTDEWGNIGNACGVEDTSAASAAPTSIMPVDTSAIPEDTTAIGNTTTVEPGDSLADAQTVCSITEVEIQQMENVDISVSPPSVDFGEVPIGFGLRPTQQVFIQNAGRFAPLHLLGITLSGDPDFTISHDCPAYLLPAQGCSVTVLFSPQAEGARSAVLTIQSDDPDEGSLQVDISGAGVSSEGEGDGSSQPITVFGGSGG